jgi:two-component system cell cycle sensor histidine kinase/response regulator CckA
MQALSPWSSLSRGRYSTVLRRGNQVVKQNRTECVLIVEDEHELRGMMERVLTHAGYQVLEAPDGREALQLITEVHAAIDVIITDIVMPWMGGEELIHEVRKAGHRIPIICTSGFVKSIYELPDSVPDALLSKPFTPRQLVASVEYVLDRDA